MHETQNVPHTGISHKPKSPQNTAKVQRRYGVWLPVLLGSVLALLVGIGGFVFWGQHVDSFPGYSAVFLSNGQVYFGELTDTQHAYMTLTNVYYFGRGLETTSEEDLSLVKLGTEVHGPTDAMQINKDQVLFIQKLAPSSRILEAIASYQGTDR